MPSRQGWSQTARSQLHGRLHALPTQAVQSIAESGPIHAAQARALHCWMTALPSALHSEQAHDTQPPQAWPAKPRTAADRLGPRSRLTPWCAETLPPGSPLETPVSEDTAAVVNRGLLPAQVCSSVHSLRGGPPAGLHLRAVPCACPRGAGVAAVLRHACGVAAQDDPV